MLQIKNTLGGGKPEGLYAWTKNEYTPEQILENVNITLNYVEYSESSPASGARYSITSDDFDVNLINDVSFFYGFAFDFGSYGTGILGDNGIMTFSNTSESSQTCYWIANSKQFVIGNRNMSGNHTASKSNVTISEASIGDFIDYIVSDKETAYPDGGEKGGYYYKKADEGLYVWKEHEIGSELKEFNKSVSTLPYSFYSGCAVVLNGEIHILGSNNSSDYTKHYKWDGSSWVSVSTLPYNFRNGSAVMLDGEIHILGTEDDGSSSFQRYHYKWNGSSWVSVSTLPYSFYRGSAVVLNGCIHILGSGVGSSTYTKHYKFDGSSWTSVSTLPYNFYNGSAVVLDNEIHILGGDGGLTNHYKFDGSSWTSVSTLPYQFRGGSVVVFDNEMHILGGNAGLTNHYKFDGSSWTSVSTLPYNLYYGSVVIFDNGIHILGTSNVSGYYKAHYLIIGYVPVYTFLDYIVSDKETAYPDGGEKGGYWYEKVGGFLTGTITQTTKNKTTLSFEYGSNKTPKAFYTMHMGEVNSGNVKYLVYSTWYDESQGLNNGAYAYYNPPYVYYTQGVGGAVCEATFNGGTVTLGGNNYYYGTYLWVAIF